MSLGRAVPGRARVPALTQRIRPRHWHPPRAARFGPRRATARTVASRRSRSARSRRARRRSSPGRVRLGDGSRGAGPRCAAPPAGRLPHGVDQRIDADDATAVKRKQRKQALALGAAHVRRPSAGEDLERAEKPNFQRGDHAAGAGPPRISLARSRARAGRGPERYVVTTVGTRQRRTRSTAAAWQPPRDARPDPTTKGAR